MAYRKRILQPCSICAKPINPVDYLIGSGTCYACCVRAHSDAYSDGTGRRDSCVRQPARPVCLVRSVARVCLGRCARLET